MKYPGGGGPFHEKAFKISLVVTSFISVLLTAIVLSAGTDAGRLEQLHILYIDTSKIGKEVVSNAGSKVSDACDSIPDVDPPKLPKIPIFGRDSARDVLEVRSLSDACKNAVKEGEKKVGEVTESAAASIGLKQYYSVHIGALCEGDIEDEKPKVKTCTRKFHAGSTEISNSVEPLKKIPGAEDIGEKISEIPNKIARTAYPFLVIVLLLALAFLFAIGVACLEGDSKLQNILQEISLWGAIICVTLSSLGLFVCATLITAVAEEIKDKINKFNNVGIFAGTSPALYALMWVSLVFTWISLGMLIYLWILAHKGTRTSKDRSQTTTPGGSTSGFMMPK
ncbi:hypothetical protein MYCTH_2112701 [Thermothelomyces thermophilus ATCC 42464]|uniref:Uncharacterized protein n=1 Tax=Thermothelomyces thermophilus (strain ATCC 42464 / BCRC 31852 / DSM 1799) TaxID=573729 RepID=G2QL26_THET4|nr:uncharacterized protein MYCTH_2112701 [Thermothelomyces thermophilus ATCC 42464]AEO60658.1 hypothetical protein MYCTH_2112701 [Thermothelomyces thermophilus ATCC 42464]